MFGPLAVLHVVSSFAITPLRKRELISWLLLPSICHDAVFLLSLPQCAMGWSVVCDCHTHLLF